MILGMPFSYYPERNIIFIQIPKTASRSIRRAFFPKIYRRLIYAKLPIGIPSFAFVRNPFDRFMSAFNMFCSGYSVDDVLSIVSDPGVPIGTTNRVQIIKFHCLPMAHPCFDLENVTRIFRYEDLINEWNALAEFLKIPVPKRTHIGGRYPKRKIVSRDRDLIYKFYAKDFRRFNYNR